MQSQRIDQPVLEAPWVGTLPRARLGELPGPRLRTPRRVVDAGREASETGPRAVSVPVQTDVATTFFLPQNSSLPFISRLSPALLSLFTVNEQADYL